MTISLTLIYRYVPVFKIETSPEIFMSTGSSPLPTNSGSFAEIQMIQERENLITFIGKLHVRNYTKPVKRERKEITI